jgi:hypothetical protein
LSASGGSLRAPRRSRTATIAIATGLALVAIALLVPDGALAHGIVGKTDLPIPRWLFAWAAAVVLVISPTTVPWSCTSAPPRPCARSTGCWR